VPDFGMSKATPDGELCCVWVRVVKIRDIEVTPIRMPPE
jgi:hypothetical protein